MPRVNYPIVDGDGHVMEPRRMWTQMLDERYRGEKGLDYRKEPDGTTQLYIEGKRFPYGRKEGTANSPEDLERFADAIADRYGTTSHVKDMDREGVMMSFLYPTVGLGHWCVDDPGLAMNWAETYNTWLADRCTAAPDRLMPVALIPRQDPRGMLRELDRTVGRLGMKAAVIFPNIIHGKRLDDPSYEPFYAELERANVPLTIHIGGFVKDRTIATDRFHDWFNLHVAGHPLEMMLGCLALITGGVLDRHPSLRVAFLESGTGWLPFWLDRIHEHQEIIGKEVGHLSREAIDYFRDQCYITFDPDDASVPYVAQCVGSDKLFYASDYPHFDSKFPESANIVLDRTDLTNEQKKLMLSDNPITFYGVRDIAKRLARV